MMNSKNRPDKKVDDVSKGTVTKAESIRAAQRKAGRVIAKERKTPYVKIILTALVLVALLYQLPFIQYFVYGSSTLVHELGHTLTAIMLARPAGPFFSGIGMLTHVLQQQWWLMVVLFPFYLFLIYRWYTTYGRISIPSTLLIIIFFVIFFLPVASNNLISFMGVGGEIIAAFALCYSALNPNKRTINAKRCFYLTLGLILYSNVVIFVGNIFGSQEYVERYHSRDDGLANDLVQIQQSLGLSIYAQAGIIIVLLLFSFWFIWHLTQQPVDLLKEFFNKFKETLPKFGKSKSKKTAQENIERILREHNQPKK